MATADWNTPLRADQNDNPVMFSAIVDLQSSIIPPPSWELEKIFKTKSYKLQTWGRAKNKDGKDIKENNPHWIALRASTPLHTDPAYPRYSHHLKIKVDDGISVRGINKKQLLLKRGIFYILDTHSPHQVVNENGGWNIAVSIDCKKMLEPLDCVKRCMQYALIYKNITVKPKKL